ncbi:MAG: hypothetical protein M0004_14350 [Actinomycetota bacterium]|nr:hypothetical protein [Actinomycetota bacterium]
MSFAAARGGARRELRGVALEVREDAVRLVATDSYRLVIRDLALAVDVPGRPLRAVLELTEMERFLAAGEAGFGGAATLLAGSRGELLVELGEKRTCLGSIGGDFPDYEALLVALPAGSNGVVARQALRDSLARAGGTATLHFDARGLSVAARGEVMRLPGTWPGPPRQVLVNSDYLAEALEHLAGPDVVIEVGEPLQPVVLRSADTGTCTVWTMPIRPES